MNYKSHYDHRHSFLFFKKKKMTLLKLHYKYDVSLTLNIFKKLTQQFVNSFKIIAKIDRLTYKLNISKH